MPQVVRCMAGHFYDAALFGEECPHCRERLSGGQENRTTKNRMEVAKLAREYLMKHSPVLSPEQLNVVSDNSSTVAPSKAGKRLLGRVKGEEQVMDSSSDRRNLSEEDPAASDPAASELTAAFRAPKQSTYFVTGWIVCVDGPDKGHVFSLYQGYHSIGYGRKNQICILEDLDIAKGVHCYLIYDDRNNRFYLMPEGENVTFLNGERMMGPQEIVSGDLFQLGRTTFEFIAFCREGRKWEKKDIGKHYV
ncbi:MAG: FHA domain-containing protein [Lachnospiraceae bacterium]|nr:FHA domain-containing protein [Lachnospiraceae bacterium]